MRLTAVVRNRKLLAGVAFLVFLLAVAFWPEAVPVDVGRVERGILRVTVDEEGETRVRDRFVVSAPVSGRLERIEVEPGDAVRRGEIVARLRPASPALLDARSLAEARAAVEAAQDAVGRARAERDRARAADDRAHSDLERSRRLFEQGIVAKDEWEARQTDARAAGEALRAAEFAVGVAEDEEQRARSRLLQGPTGNSGRVVEVRSPVDGVVLRRVRESEAVVPVGDALIEVGDPLKLEIVSDLLSTDAVRTRPGQEVLIEHWGGDKPLRARVRRVEPSGFLKISALGVEEQRVNIVADFEDPSEAWRALGDAYRVELRVVIWEAQDAIRVASSSLFRRGDGWAAFVVDGGRARLRGVEAGHSNGLETEVLSGLSPGQAVVVHPSDRVADGIRVAPREP